MQAPRSPRQPGERIAPLQLDTLAHGTLAVPDPRRRWTHLQFRRFAGCPVCNLHLRSFARRHGELTEHGVTTAAFFHSPAALMRPYQGELPFPTVPDPERRYYALFGVERSRWAVFHPRVMWDAVAGLVRAKSNPWAGGGDQRGLPADFLLDPGGTIVAARYGAHAADHWSVDEVLALARTDAATTREAPGGTGPSESTLELGR